MGKIFDSEAAEALWQKENGKEEYKGKQDYARKMSLKELDEYARGQRAKFQVGDTLYKMGQESLAYSRQYQEMLDSDNREVKPFVKPKAVAPKYN